MGASSDNHLRVWETARALGGDAAPRHVIKHDMHTGACSGAPAAPQGTSSPRPRPPLSPLPSPSHLSPPLSHPFALSAPPPPCSPPGRWLTPIKAPWDPASDATFLIGDMTRKVRLFDASSGSLLRDFSSELLTAVPTQVAAHPSPLVSAMAGGTASGRLYLWT